MNLAVKKAWVEALRSGKYIQTKERLHRTDGGMCCLGVLADLYIKTTGEGLWELEEDHYTLITGEYRDRQSQILTKQVVLWADLESRNPNSSKESQNLADLNDGGVTFLAIADVIENDF